MQITSLENVRFLLVIFILLVLSACSGYSKIDAENWSTLSVSLPVHAVRISVPGGYYRSENLYKSEITEQYIALGYDYRFGPTVYGGPYAMTRFYLSTLVSNGIEQVPELTTKSGCANLGPEAMQTCMSRSLENYTSLVQIDNNWYFFDDPPSSNEVFPTYIRYYFKELGNGQFLEFIGVISSEAYMNASLRAQRFQMMEDIFETITIVPLQDGDA